MPESVSFYNATQLPPEVAAKVKNLQIQEQIANALMAQGMRPVEPVASKGSLTPLISPFQGISSLAHAYIGAKGNEEVSKGFGAAAKDYQEGSQKALTDYLRSREGTPARGPVEGAASPSASTPPDPFGAAVTAAGSTYPMVHQLGMADLQQQLKGGMSIEEIMKLSPDSFDPQSMIAAASAARAGHKSPWTFLKARTQPLVVADRVVDKYNPGGAPLADYSAQYEKGPDGRTRVFKVEGSDGVFQLDTRSGKIVPVDPSTKVSQTTSVDARDRQQSKGAEQAAIDQNKLVGESARIARATDKTIRDSHKILEALDSGQSIAGFASNLRLQLLRIGEFFNVTGKNEDEKLAQTAKLMQNLAKAELHAAELMRGQGQVSNLERGILRNAAAGTFGRTPAELRQLAMALDESARDIQMLHRQLIESYKADYPDVKTKVWEVPESPAYNPKKNLEKYKVPGRHNAPN